MTLAVLPNIDLRVVAITLIVACVIGAIYMDRIGGWLKSQWQAYNDKKFVEPIEEYDDVGEADGNRAVWLLTDLEAEFVAMPDHKGDNGFAHIDQLRKILFGQNLTDPTLSQLLQKAILKDDKDAVESIQNVMIWSQKP